jgi:hypothetical protein
MSQSIKDFERSGNAGEDMSSAQYHIVQLDATGDVEIGEGNTDLLIGVLQNKPKEDEAALIRFLGTSKVIAGGSVSIGNWLTSDGSGHAIATTTEADVIIGRALEAADSADIFEVQLGIFVK